MAGYIIVNVQVIDPLKYAAYTTMVSASIEHYGGRFLVRGGDVEALEGSFNPSRMVVLEFPRVERARAWWSSEEYREAKRIRQGFSSTDMFVVEGV
jgi:uncharacterized protein (DUF1330 family)